MPHDSHILTLLHFCLQKINYLTMGLVYRFLRIPKEKITLQHAETYLVLTTLFLILLIVGGQFWSPCGWLLLFIGNVRLIQILSINLSTLLFDTSTVRDGTESVKRARWHFVAIGFSVVDIMLIFGFAYQFLDHRYQILNQHFPGLFEYIYYAVTTFTTIGFGDIYPVTTLGRIIVLYESTTALFFLIFIVSGALSRLQRNGHL